MVNPKHIFYVGAFIGLTILGIIFLPKDEIVVIDNNISSGEGTKDFIYVHIEGAVEDPGVKEVEKGTRLFELIEIAGGELEDADLSRLNLSQVLKDEQKIIVPFKAVEQVVENSNVSKTISYSTYSNDSQLVNINYASQKELETLPGIGTQTAQKIIDYRNENGLFNSIEDIKNVSGIGDAKFEKIKDKITEVGGV